MASRPATLGQTLKSILPHLRKEPPVKLMTQELRKLIPPLYSQSNKEYGTAVVVAKYFTPDSSWSWLVVEWDGEDTMFGLVDGHEKELGYFSLAELQSLRGPLGLPVERDLYWKPKLKEIAPELFVKRT